MGGGHSSLEEKTPMRRRLDLPILATGSLPGWIPDLAAAQADKVTAAMHTWRRWATGSSIFGEPAWKEPGHEKRSKRDDCSCRRSAAHLLRNGFGTGDVFAGPKKQCQ